MPQNQQTMAVDRVEIDFVMVLTPVSGNNPDSSPCQALNKYLTTSEIYSPAPPLENNK